MCLFKFWFEVVHRATIEHQAANAFLRFQTDSHDTTDWNNPRRVLPIMPAEKANHGKCGNAKYSIIDEALEATEPRFPAESMIAIASISYWTANFPAKQAKNLRCCLFALIVGTTGSGYAKDCSGFLVCIDLTNWEILKIVPWSLQAHILYKNIYPRLAVPAAQCSI